MWNLEEAARTVRLIEPLVRAKDYHTCLGGGVLHRGYSAKDIDLFFLPLYSGKGDPDTIRSIVETTLGTIEPMYDDAMCADYEANTHPGAKVMGKVDFHGRRIDVFIHG
jgi:hypothetical protein